jgi:hypothetical protein
MQTSISYTTFLLTLLIIGMAGTALADITLTTDKPVYFVGEIVHITAHNNGPDVEELVSDPYFVIFNEDTSECVFGCVGLPVVTPLEVGETVFLDWDTGAVPDVPGNYSVFVAANGVASVSYFLNAAVSNETRSWGDLKALFR